MSRSIDTYSKFEHERSEELSSQVITVANTPVLLFQLDDANTEVDIIGITIVNNDNQVRAYKIYLDNNGATYDQTTLVSNGTVEKNSHVVPSASTAVLTISNVNASVAFQASFANSLTVKLFGRIRPIR